MRIVILLISFVVAISCVKKPSKSPIPVIEFKDFTYKKVSGLDSGFVTFEYEDGDGDIFVGKFSSQINVVIITLRLDDKSGNFIQDTTVTPDGVKIPIVNAQSVKQPGDGYKGNAVKGTITVPFGDFRVSDKVKVIKHQVYVVDEAGNKSNVVLSPVYNLTI